MLLAEILGEFLAIEFVEVLSGVRQLVRARYHQRVVGIVDDTFQVRHLLWVDDGCYMVAHKEQSGFGMVHDIVYLFCIELMQDRHGNGPVGECGDKSHGPLTGVAPAEGNLITFLDTAVFKQDVNLFNLARHIVEL